MELNEHFPPQSAVIDHSVPCCGCDDGSGVCFFDSTKSNDATATNSSEISACSNRKASDPTVTMMGSAFLATTLADVVFGWLGAYICIFDAQDPCAGSWMHVGMYYAFSTMFLFGLLWLVKLDPNDHHGLPWTTLEESFDFLKQLEKNKLTWLPNLSANFPGENIIARLGTALLFIFSLDFMVHARASTILGPLFYATEKSTSWLLILSTASFIKLACFFVMQFWQVPATSASEPAHAKISTSKSPIPHSAIKSAGNSKYPWVSYALIILGQMVGKSIDISNRLLPVAILTEVSLFILGSNYPNPGYILSVCSVKILLVFMSVMGLLFGSALLGLKARSIINPETESSSGR